MPLRVNPIVLLGLIVVLVLSIAVLASARGGASDALGAAESQIGKPFVLGTDGPGTFSCVGLMRYALRTAGVDDNAPWVPEEYLSKYAPVAGGDLQPGDIVIYPGWATMYAGNGMLVNSNEMEGVVTHTPMDVAGEPLGIVRPYSGQPAHSGQPAPQQAETAKPVIEPIAEPMPVEQQVPVEEIPVVEQPA